MAVASIGGTGDFTGIKYLVSLANLLTLFLDYRHRLMADRLKAN